jgi:serine/threonine protein kinase
MTQIYREMMDQTERVYNFDSPRQTPKPKMIGNYEVQRILGRGAYGTVKLAVDTVTGEKVAIKILKHRNVRSSRDYDMIEREKRALVTLDHPNIVKLKEIIENEVKQATYLVFEYVAGGELFGYIVSHGRLSEATARKFMRQIVSALEYCHFNLIVHRDLKPENLLLDENENIKITDFGLANFITPNNKFSTFCGSLHYAAPEILNGHQYAGPAVDIYALGVILYCLLNGQQPFDADSPIEMMKKIQHGLTFHHDTSKDVRDLITKMMAVDPKKRITMDDLRKHPWILKDFSGPPRSYIPAFERVIHIDEEVMHDLVAVGFEDTPKSRGWIMKNKQHAQITSAYHLFLHRRRQMSVHRSHTTPHTRSRSQSTAPDLGVPRRSTDQALDTRGVVVQTRGELRNSKQNNSTGKLDFLEVISEDPKSAPQSSNNNNKDLTSQIDQIITEILSSNPSTSQKGTQSNPATPPASRNNDNRRNWTKDSSVWKNQSCEGGITEKFFDKAAREPRSMTPTPKPRREERHSVNMQHQSARLPKFCVRQEPDQSPTSTASNSESEIEVIRTEQKPSPSFKCDTTSSKTTDEIRKQLKTACSKTDITMKKISRHDYQFFHKKTDVHFEMEIVKMKGFKNLKGLKLKRLEGDIWAYKQLVVEFLDKLRL